MSDFQSTEFTVGGVLGRSFSVFFRNFLPFVILALIIQAPAYLAGFLFDGASFVSGDLDSLPVTGLLLIVVQMLLTYALMATLVYGTIADLRGYPASLTECIVRGLGLLFPVLIVAVIATVLIVLGTMFFVVPGLLLAILFWVVIPVAVVERPGLVACFSRSLELTRGSRWKVFGLLVVVVVMMIGFGLLTLVLAGIFGYSTLDVATGEGDISTGLTAYLIIDWLANGMATAFWSVMVAVSYHDLRIDQEGVGTEEIAAVFD